MGIEQVVVLIDYFGCAAMYFLGIISNITIFIRTCDDSKGRFVYNLYEFIAIPERRRADGGDRIGDCYTHNVVAIPERQSINLIILSVITIGQS